MLFASGGRPPSPLVKGVDNSEADVRRWLHFGTSLWTEKFDGGAVDVPARGLYRVHTNAKMRLVPGI
jgi:hypothetical protein